MKILCFNIDEDFIKYGICNESYELVETHKTPARDFRKKDLLIDKLSEIIALYKNADSVAISIEGNVNSDNGTVCSAKIFGEANEINLKKELEEKTNAKVFIENSVNATAITLLHFGEARGEKNFICLSFSKELKASIVIDGRLFKGSTNSAGEIRYISNEANAENLISVICNLIYILNPPLIVLDSKTAFNFPIKEINEKLQAILPDAYKSTRVIASSLSNDAALIGAAYLSNN